MNGRDDALFDFVGTIFGQIKHKLLVLIGSYGNIIF